MYVYSHPDKVKKNPIVIWKDLIGNKMTSARTVYITMYTWMTCYVWHYGHSHHCAFNQQSGLVLQYSQMEMFKATVCVSAHMIESMWARVDAL